MSNDPCPICGGTHPGFKHALIPEYEYQDRRLGPHGLNYCFICNQHHPIYSFCPKMTVTCSGDLNALPEKWEA